MEAVYAYRVRRSALIFAATWALVMSSASALAIPFATLPVGTHVFGQVFGSPTPAEVRFDSPLGFTGVLQSDSVSAGGGTVAASASLGRGELKALATSPTDLLISEVAHATASLSDQIRVVNADGSAITGPVSGTLRMHMGGTLTLDYARQLVNGGNSALSRVDLQIMPIVGASYYDTDAAIAINSRVGAACPVLDCVTASAPSLSVSQDLAIDFVATPTVDVILLQAFLEVYAANIATADIFHTATLFVDLPAGYSFTSASGVLLSEVPEPGTGLLMMAGLLTIAGWRRSSV